MRLYIPDLKKEEGKFFPFHESVKVAGEDDDVIIEVKLQAAYIPNRLLVKGEWQVNIKGECSRCLEKVIYAIKDRFYEEFLHLKGPAEEKGFGEGIELENGEKFVFRGEFFDLREYLRQAFLMSHPLKILCQEDCKGLCPRCGANRNKEECRCLEKDVDFRWEALEKIKRGL